MKCGDTYLWLGGILNKINKNICLENENSEYKSCIICESSDYVMEFKDQYICRDCIETARQDKRHCVIGINKNIN